MASIQEWNNLFASFLEVDKAFTGLPGHWLYKNFQQFLLVALISEGTILEEADIEYYESCFEALDDHMIVTDNDWTSLKDDGFILERFKVFYLLARIISIELNVECAFSFMCGKNDIIGNSAILNIRDNASRDIQSLLEAADNYLSR